jgi:hypothetical protein
MNLAGLLDQIDAVGHKYPFVMLGAYYVWCSAVQAMPTPTESSGAGYRWLFGFAHTLAANFGLVGKVKSNGSD